MYNHNKAQQSKNRVHISRYKLYMAQFRHKKLQQNFLDLLGGICSMDWPIEV